MLTFAEEIMLLAIDGKSGLIRPLPERSLDFALSGALLLELAFAKKLDADIKNIHIVSKQNIRNPILKDALAALPSGRYDMPTEEALRALAAKGAKWKSKTVDSLADKKIIKKSRLKVFFFIKRKSYPIVDHHKVEFLRKRIRNIVMNEDEIPSPREVVLVSLVNACALGPAIFSEDELIAHGERISRLSKMDLIGIAIARPIEEIRSAIAAAMAVSEV